MPTVASERCRSSLRAALRIPADVRWPAPSSLPPAIVSSKFSLVLVLISPNCHRRHDDYPSSSRQSDSSSNYKVTTSTAVIGLFFFSAIAISTTTVMGGIVILAETVSPASFELGGSGRWKSRNDSDGPSPQPYVPRSLHMEHRPFCICSPQPLLASSQAQHAEGQ